VLVLILTVLHSYVGFDINIVTQLVVLVMIINCYKDNCAVFDNNNVTQSVVLVLIEMGYTLRCAGFGIKSVT